MAKFFNLADELLQARVKTADYICIRDTFLRFTMWYPAAEDDKLFADIWDRYPMDNFEEFLICYDADTSKLRVPRFMKAVDRIPRPINALQ